jgi:hypothetical protein
MKSLKQIIREVGVSMDSTVLKEKMTPEAKKQLLGMFNKYNSMGKRLYEYGDVRQMAEDLLKVTDLAETYALQEADDDMLQTGRIHRDMKLVRKEANDLRKHTSEAWKANENLKACYQRIGTILSSYYELN